MVCMHNRINHTATVRELAALIVRCAYPVLVKTSFAATKLTF